MGYQGTFFTRGRGGGGGLGRNFLMGETAWLCMCIWAGGKRGGGESGWVQLPVCLRDRYTQ